MKFYNAILFILLFGSVSFTALGQKDTTEVEAQKVLVIKNDGATYTGYILTDDAREILIETDQVGKVYIPKHFIKSIAPFDPNKIEENPTDSETVIGAEEDTVSVELVQETRPITSEVEIDKPDSLEFKNYISTKYIQTDNALPLRRGESFLKVMPIGIEAQIPLTKNWSLGAISTFWGMPVALKTKYSFEIDPLNHLSLDLGYGTMAFGSWSGRGIRDGGGTASVTYTFGDRSKNFSAKIGYAFAHQFYEDWIFDEVTGDFVEITAQMDYYHIAYATFGGMLQLTDKTTFVIDAGAALVDWGVFASVGAAMRFGRTPRRQWQLGGSLIMFDGFIIPIPIPHISYTYVFSKRNP